MISLYTAQIPESGREPENDSAINDENSQQSGGAQDSKPQKKKGKIAGIISSVLVVILLLISAYVLLCNFTGRVPFFGSYATVRIISPSMEPTIPTGTYIMVRRVDAAQVRVGDVILFYSHDPAIAGKMNTHRVVEILPTDNGLQFTTKGDNNTLKDQYPVYDEDICGLYVKNLATLTKVAGWVQVPWVFLLILVVPALILMVGSFRDLKKAYKTARHDAMVEAEIRKIEDEMKKGKGDADVQGCIQGDQTETKDQSGKSGDRPD